MSFGNTSGDVDTPICEFSRGLGPSTRSDVDNKPCIEADPANLAIPYGSPDPNPRLTFKRRSGRTQSTMDRRLPGIIAVSLIVSTMISHLAFLRSPEEYVTVIRNTAPAQIRRQVDLELTHKFVVGLVVRARVEELVIRYAFFVPASPIPTPGASSLHDWGERLPGYAVQRDLVSSLGFEPEEMQGTLEGNGSEIPYLLFDIGEGLPAFTEWSHAEDAVAAHLILPSKEGNATHMVGKSGFYYYRSQLAKITVLRNEQEQIYISQRSAQELKPGERPMEEAPQNGRIVFTDLMPDDAISVIIEVMGRADQGRGSLSMIRLYVNGKIDKVLANFMG